MSETICLASFRVFSRLIFLFLSAARVAAVACDLGHARVVRIAAVVAAIIRIARNPAAATAMGALSIVSHTYLRYPKAKYSKGSCRVLFFSTWTLTQFARRQSVYGHT
jgi:hypothetical protein